MFSDDEWDGEPQEPAGTIGEGGDGEGRIREGGDGEGRRREGGDGEGINKKLKIRLADGKVRELQSMTSTYFYVDGKPISAEEFLQRLFDTLKLPNLFGSEEKLRKFGQIH